MLVTDVERTGETDSTSGALDGSSMALTSAIVRVACRVWVPLTDAPPPNRPVLITVRVLVPSCSIRLSTACEEPVPNATRMITAATPIRTPEHREGGAELARRDAP